MTMKMQQLSPQLHFNRSFHHETENKPQLATSLHLEHSGAHPRSKDSGDQFHFYQTPTDSENLHLTDDMEPDGLGSDVEDEFDGDVTRDGDESHLARGGRSSSSDSGRDTAAGGQDGIEASAKKKPRITLARGGACVACRNRKLKCTGERPCKTCLRANIECRYEELPRKKPRAVMLEERVAELEAYLHLKAGEPLPKYDHSSRGSHPIFTPTLTPPDHGLGIDMRPATASSDNTASSSSGPQPSSLSLQSHRELPPNMAAVNTGRTDVAAGSQLELALIQVVLPYAPYLLMPVHPQRFLALLTLPISNSSRPHPALLYVLFSEAVRILEQNVPLPRVPQLPSSLFSPPFLATPATVDVSWILRQVGGSSVALLERARKELDNGIRNVDRPFDLARAAIGIARALYALGRFIEGWNIPVSRLVISCGLHRLTGVYLPPDGSPVPAHDFMPKPYAPAYHYRHSHSLDVSSGAPTALPVIRMRPVIIPPARDEIELAERVMTFWAAKAQDWEAGVGWGWTVSLDDRQCTTEWGWGWGACEPKGSRTAAQSFAIRDLYDPTSAIHTSPFLDTTYMLAIKSLGLLHRASSLFDTPESNYPTSQADGTRVPTHIPAMDAVQAVETALRLFRQRIPAPFVDGHRPNTPLDDKRYDGCSDPWWIMLQANLYTAEMIMWREMANHRRGAYETAVGCARAMVGLIQRIQPDVWANVDMIVALDISLSSRLLFKEADRLQRTNQHPAAAMAAEEAEILRTCLARDYSKWLPMASLHALIVQRVREGWPEKEGEYERT